MTDNSSLLHELRIDRSQIRKARAGLWLTFGAALVSFAAVVAYLAPSFTALHTASAPLAVRTTAATGEEAAIASGTLLEASGYVVARRRATVSAKITDRVVAVMVEEGQHVEPGQILAKLDDTNTSAALALAKSQAAAARVALEDAKPIFQRSQQIFDQGVSTRAALDAARAQYDAARSSLAVAERAVDVAQRNQDDTEVRAPFSGIVTEKAANEGEIVSPITAGGGFTRTGICTVVDMSSLEVGVDVNENSIKLVQVGQAATIKLDAYPDQRFAGRVIAIVPTADQSRGTVLVRIGFDRQDPHILPQMTAHVSLADGPGRTASAQFVRVPSSAIVVNRSRGTVFVIAGDRLEKRNVVVGSRDGREVTILSGLNGGEILAEGDLDKLSDGLKVTVLH
jgi:RND family efflux transporter MFP subunit